MHTRLDSTAQALRLEHEVWREGILWKREDGGGLEEHPLWREHQCCGGGASLPRLLRHKIRRSFANDAIGKCDVFLSIEAGQRSFAADDHRFPMHIDGVGSARHAVL